MSNEDQSVTLITFRSPKNKPVLFSKSLSKANSLSLPLSQSLSVFLINENHDHALKKAKRFLHHTSTFIPFGGWSVLLSPAGRILYWGEKSIQRSKKLQEDQKKDEEEAEALDFRRKKEEKKRRKWWISIFVCGTTSTKNGKKSTWTTRNSRKR